MSHWNAIRTKALKLRRTLADEHGLDAGSLIDPQKLIDLAADSFDLLIEAVHADSPVLQGSVALLKTDSIFFRHDLEDGYRQYSIAHELGHHVLHKTESDCTSQDIINLSAADEAPSTVREIEGYGMHERREREANLFALEFLLPCDVARKLFAVEPDCVALISSSTKLPRSLIMGQLSTALLVPKAPQPSNAEKSSRKRELDNSQSAAAHAESGPLLVIAGPGTGKTHTLVERVRFLIEERNVAPDRILALTFSHKATNEMRERISESLPDQGHRMTVMTFHGYALELLRKYWLEAGLDKDSKILEPLDTILLLEELLPQLGLERLVVDYDPLANLPDLSTVISRAKDELVGPDAFREFAQEQLVSARDEKDRLKALNALEAARVYEAYQNHLHSEKLLDFNELIFRAVELIQSNSDVRHTIRSRYDAILVDEFQDINRASGILVKEIAGDGKGLWAVGDLRQSIYRWRGASPDNVTQFDSDYRDAVKISLDTNYRSSSEIVDLFSQFAKSMQAMHDPAFNGWAGGIDASSRITHHVAGDFEAEVEAIATEARRLSEEGVPLGSQAVICRKNDQLNAIAEGLVKRGVPILFLGDLFSCPEVRDLLSFLDVVSSQDGTGLYRLAKLPQYSIPDDDVRKILAEATKEGPGFLKYLESGSAPAGISSSGASGLAALRSDVLAIPKGVSASSALGEFVFVNGGFIRRILESEDSVASSHRLLAVYQFLSFARSAESKFADKGMNQIPAFLNHVRRLARFNQSRDLSHVPASAEGVEGLRLLTVHRSKGLEFDAVYIPFLAEGKFPMRKQGSRLPAPRKLVEGQGDRHYEEEECLFFVAASRAKRFLHLSRAESYNDGMAVEQSRFLHPIGVCLPASIEGDASAPARPSDSGDFPKDGVYWSSQIRTYEKCPRKFYYRYVLGIGRDRRYDDTSYAAGETVRTALNDIRQQIKKRGSISESDALGVLEMHWALGEMESRTDSEKHHQHAERMVRAFIKRVNGTADEIRPETLECKFENGIIKVTPEHLQVDMNRVLIRSFSGRKHDPGITRPNDNEYDEFILLQMGAKTSYFGAEVQIIQTYLETDTDEPVTIGHTLDGNRRRKFERLLASIASKRFDADPSPRECPKCPYYFICPT